MFDLMGEITAAGGVGEGVVSAMSVIVGGNWVRWVEALLLSYGMVVWVVFCIDGYHICWDALARVFWVGG